MSVTVLFPPDSVNRKGVDPDFAAEAEAAREFFPIATDPSQVKTDHTLYRGWMLTVPEYRNLERQLERHWLLTTPHEYENCHYLPHLLQSLGLGDQLSALHLNAGERPTETAIMGALRCLGEKAIVRDFVKSQKHYWNEACFIPDCYDTAAVMSVVNRFLDLQGESLTGGLVFRSYLPLKIVGKHPRSGMPLAAEFRTFWFGGECILSSPYWGDLTEGLEEPPIEEIRDRFFPKKIEGFRQVPSPFFTLDVAQQTNGDWVVVEGGDGGVSGLPKPELASTLYREIHRKMSS